MTLDPNNEDDYAILTALRGPDSASSTNPARNLKKLTTSVLRDAVGMEHIFTGPIVFDIQSAEMHWSEVMGTHERLDAWDFWISEHHFRHHIEDAFLALNRKGDAYSHYVEYYQRLKTKLKATEESVTP